MRAELIWGAEVDTSEPFDEGYLIYPTSLDDWLWVDNAPRVKLLTEQTPRWN